MQRWILAAYGGHHPRNEKGPQMSTTPAETRCCRQGAFASAIANAGATSIAVSARHPRCNEHPAPVFLVRQLGGYKKVTSKEAIDRADGAGHAGERGGHSTSS
jgi:hypothetical protein